MVYNNTIQRYGHFNFLVLLVPLAQYFQYDINIYPETHLSCFVFWLSSISDPRVLLSFTDYINTFCILFLWFFQILDQIDLQRLTKILNRLFTFLPGTLLDRRAFHDDVRIFRRTNRISPVAR